MNELIKKIVSEFKGEGRDKLIPVLQKVQSEIGFISKEAVVEIGSVLNLPSSKIYGVATFYNQFRFEPKGKYHILVCRGTACHVKGSADTLEAVERELGIKAGKTSRDGLFSIEVVACLGACGLAPLLCVNDEFYANVSRDKVSEIIKSYRKRESEA
ncbi:MAG TPA: NADH-quinone oxidoreductase subunit NuoE [bacterium]|nr:NADH-quinone oxidoreductase subunit NuoE [bacterium]